MSEINVSDYVIKTDRNYMETHEWIMDNGDGTYSMGISDYAQKMLKEISYVQFEDEGASFEQKEVIVVVESLKAIGEVYAPFDCEIVENNTDLDDNPDLITSSPYDKGFLVRIKAMSDDRSSLITAEAYAEIVRKELEEL